jgi:hypothetical protein
MGHREAHAQPHQRGYAWPSRGYARAVANARDRGRCRERLEQLSESSLDCESLQREAIVRLQGVIGFDLGDEAVLASREALGCRGWKKAYRDGSDASFTEDDLELLAQVGRALGSPVRRRLGGASRAHSRRELLARFSGASDLMSRHG